MKLLSRRTNRSYIASLMETMFSYRRLKLDLSLSCDLNQSVDILLLIACALPPCNLCVF